MIKRPLGNTGIEVSELAFGGVEIGIPYGIGVRNEADMISEAGAVDLIHAALDSGINFFDTARMYGNSERIMGKAFTGHRSEVIISTKCRHFRDEYSKLPGSSIIKKIVRESLAESLEALQTDYVDVYMLHQVDMEILENDDVSGLFLDLKRSGVIRTTGVSTYTAEETGKAIETDVWDVIQLPFNLLDQRQEACFSLASAKGKGVVIRSVLLKGILSDKGKNLHPALKKVENHLACFNELLDESAPDLASLAMKFALSFAGVSAILVGMDRPEYLNKSLESANGIYLDKYRLARAKELAYKDPGFIDLPYWDKMKWLT
jgi:aryl-alcohol dehydrogenase-like predicted oxidoreductase